MMVSMKTNLCKLLVLAALGWGGALYGQDENSGFGRLSGQVLDAKTGAVLSGAAVALLEDPAFFMRTDLEGRYAFRDVPSGMYTIRVFKGGYEPFDVAEVTIANDEVTRIDIPLPARVQAAAEAEETPSAPVASDIFEMAAFEVTADRIMNTEVALLEVRQRSISIGDAIGSDFISRAGVGDAAEAMTKVVGANVIDGKYAVIRGLGDRYSNTLLNGAALPSNDPSKKTVQLDIIPADLMEEVSTTKTFTPDKPGDFTGGSVNVKTKSFPEAFVVKLSASVGFNTQTTRESMAVIPDGDMDFFGKVDVAIPNSVPELPVEYNALRGTERKVVEKALHAAPLYAGTKEAPFDMGLQFSVGDSLPVLKEGKFGYVVSFTRDESYSLIPKMESNRYIGVDADRPKSGFLVDKASESVSWGALLNLAFQWNPFNELSYNYIKNQTGDNAVSQGRKGFDTETENNKPGLGVLSRNLPNGRDSAVQYLSYDTLKHTLRELDSHQFKGRHVFDDFNNAEIAWLASFAETSEDTPIDRSFGYVEFVYPDGASDDLWYFAANPRYPERTYGTLKDTKDSYSVDITLPIRLEAVTALKFKTGVSYVDGDRVSLQRTFSYDWSLAVPTRVPEKRFEFFDRLEESIWLDGNVEGFGSGEVGIDELTTTSGNARSYFGTEEITAYYLMADLEVTEWMRFIGGVRSEETTMTVAANKDFVNPALFVGGSDEGLLDESDALPALHTVIRLGEEGTMNLRASYGQTLARPTFREFSPFRSFDSQTREIVQGNPGLSRTLVDNYDFRWEWFFSPGELVAVSLYHKEFADPIISTARANGTSYLFSWENVGAGTISGAEFELRKVFWERLTIGGNASYIESEIDPIEGGLGSATIFEGQPDYIMNFNIGYADEESGFSVNLFYNYVDDVLRYVGQNIPNVLQKGRTSLDFNISKEWFGVRWKLSVKNLLNDPYELYYETATAPILERYYRGKDWSLSASKSF
jgi:hypothetical protein